MNRLTLIFVSLTDDPGTDRIVAAMGQLGARCVIVGPPGAFAAQSRYAEAHIRLPAFGGVWGRSLKLRAALERALSAYAPVAVIPLDDLGARLLRDPAFLGRTSRALHNLIVQSLGREASYEICCSRALLIERARRLGVTTPLQALAPDIRSARRAAELLGYPLVLKREETCGGSGVSIVASPSELSRAFKRSRDKMLLKALAGRSLGFTSDMRNALTLQQWISGPLAFHVAACADGEVLEGASFLSERVNPPEIGASTMLRPFDHVGMDETARKLVADLGCSGFVALDFLLGSNGEAALIEMNARPTATGHLGRLFGHDIYAAMLEHLGGRACERASPRAGRPETIALFPRELDRDPSGAALDERPNPLHDVPWEDPGIAEAYAAWLEQRHFAYRKAIRNRLKSRDPDTCVRMFESVKHA